ncbi:MAG: hypothetical protein ACOC3F_03670 [Desulfosudaceae bacterium]
MGLLRTIRSTLLDVIEAHERCGGRGRDDYFDEPIVHPMAEGKYLSTLATLHETRLLSADRMRSHADAALERLAATSVATAPDEAAWGLGFHRADTEPDEPFVVTTAIVASGLLDLPDGLGADMATAACTWLDRVAPRTNVEVDGGRASLHLYSPSMPVLIVNAVAVAAAVLARAGHPDKAEAERAFQAAAAVLPVKGETITMPEKVGFQDLHTALERFSRASFGVKKVFFDACCQSVLFDRKVAVREAELLRAVAYAVDIPVPPFLKKTDR